MRVMHFSEHMHVCLIDDNKFGQRQQSRVMLVEISTEKFIFYTFFYKWAVLRVRLSLVFALSNL